MKGLCRLDVITADQLGPGGWVIIRLNVTGDGWSVFAALGGVMEAAREVFLRPGEFTVVHRLEGSYTDVTVETGMFGENPVRLSQPIRVF